MIEPRDETDEVDTTDDSDTSKDEKDPVESLMDILTRDIKLSYKTCVDYKKSEDDNAKYGFDDPTLKLTIHYKEYEKVDAESGVSKRRLSRISPVPYIRFGCNSDRRIEYRIGRQQLRK